VLRHISSVKVLTERVGRERVRLALGMSRAGSTQNIGKGRTPGRGRRVNLIQLTRCFFARSSKQALGQKFGKSD